MAWPCCTFWPTREIRSPSPAGNDRPADRRDRAPCAPRPSCARPSGGKSARMLVAAAERCSGEIPGQAEQSAAPFGVDANAPEVDRSPVSGSGMRQSSAAEPCRSKTSATAWAAPDEPDGPPRGGPCRCRPRSPARPATRAETARPCAPPSVIPPKRRSCVGAYATLGKRPAWRNDER
jgi:hypothetical protein